MDRDLLLTAHTRTNQALELIPTLDGRNRRTLRLSVERARRSCSLPIKFSLKSWSSRLTLIPTLKWKTGAFVHAIRT